MHFAVSSKRGRRTRNLRCENYSPMHQGIMLYPWNPDEKPSKSLVNHLSVKESLNSVPFFCKKSQQMSFSNCASKSMVGSLTNSPSRIPHLNERVPYHDPQSHSSCLFLSPCPCLLTCLPIIATAICYFVRR